MPRVADVWFARLAVERGFVSPDTAQALVAGMPDEGAEPLADRMVARGLLTAAQAAEVRAGMVEAAGAGTVIQGIGLAPDPDDVRATIAGGANVPAAGPVEAPRDEAAATLHPGGAADELPRLRPCLFGKYQITEELGRGAMGVVYRAFDTELRREVALKTVMLGAEGDAERTQRFLREARTAATLDHPGIVPIHDMGVVDGIPYFAMSLLRGRTLEQVFASGERPGIDERVRLVAATARAVAHAHERRVIHRDLKPSNVLIDPDGGPHVMDFGLAKQLDEGARLTADGEVIGTPMYMSPEQMSGLLTRLGPPADVFSLGAILYEGIAGRPPFSGVSIAELMNQVLNADPQPPRAVRREITPDLETIVLKALEKAPERRYPSAAELAQDLERYLAGDPIEARPISRSTRVLRKAIKHRAMVLPTLLLALAGLGVGLWQWRAATERAELLAAHLARGAAGRAGGDPGAARDAFLAALGVAGENEEAKAGLAWAEGEIDRLERIREEEKRRIEAEKARLEEALRKGNLVQAVLTRWVMLGDALAELERIFTDSVLSAAEVRARGARPWARVEAFVKATPDDPTSQATMKAFAGWARRWAGWPEEGLAWMREAGELDADLPYGALLEALVCFGDYLELQPVGPISTGGSVGLKFWAGPDETAEMRALRERMQALLGKAGRAAVWGQTVEAEYRGLVTALESLQKGDFAAAHAGLTSAVDAASLHLFRAQLLFARARVCCLLGRYPQGLADLEEARALRPGGADLLVHASLLCLGMAEHKTVEGGDPVPMYERARDALAELLGRAPSDVWTQAQMGIVCNQLGHARLRRGEDPRPDFARAIDAYESAARLDPDRPHHYYNRGSLFVTLADLDRREGRDPGEWIRRAIADFDLTIRTYPEFGHHWLGRASAYELQGDVDAAAGRDPRPAYEQAVKDIDDAAARAAPTYHPSFLGQNVGARLKLASAREQYGDDGAPELARAIAAAEQSVAMQPDAADPRLALARALETQARLAQARGQDPEPWARRALAEYDAAVERGPRLWHAWAARAEARERRGQWAEAVRDWEAALERHPTHEPLRTALAAAQIQAAAGSAGSGAAWLRALAAAAEKIGAGDYAGARPLYEQALAEADAAAAATAAFRPHVRDAHYNLACIHALLAAGRDGPDAEPRPATPEAVARHRDEAFRHLEAALALGFRKAAHLAGDPDLAALHDDPRWPALVARAR